MEDHDEIYRGEIICPPTYAPLTPERVQDIVMHLPEDTGLAVVSGPPDVFAVLAGDSGRVWSRPASPKKTYTGHRTIMPSPGSSSDEDTDSIVDSSDEEDELSVVPPIRSSSRAHDLRMTYHLSMAYSDKVLPTPFIDSRDVLVSVLSRGPSRRAVTWRLGCDELGETLTFMGSTMNAFLAEGRLRWGVGFRPHSESTGIATAVYLDKSPAWKRYIDEDVTTEIMLECITIYQSHLFEQFFPIVYHTMRLRAEQLVEYGLTQPFPGSPFTICEFRDLTKRPMVEPEKQWEVRFSDMMVVTVLGRWDSAKEGQLMLHAEGRMINVKSGDTFVLPAGAQAYSFVPVSGASYQFLFSQWFDASVARWIEKGGMADHELDRKAKKRGGKEAAERLHRWVRARTLRGLQSRRFFQKIGEVSSSF
ncbi:hypothetical protein C8F01DRAFT_1303975 [Mycena amicta]|nr:hypothetical protein C8F01DRAFT_1303975 [Mycena amicta]